MPAATTAPINVRGIGVALITTIVVYVLFSTPHQKRNEMSSIQRLCAKYTHEDELTSFIWSHRAALVGSSVKSNVDGSSEVTRHLLKEGISNYDVDISMIKGDGADTWSYMVAHPSRLATAVKEHQQGSFQTVGSFLQQIAAKHARLLGDADAPARAHPLVSIEPKFSDPTRIRELVQEVVNLAGAMASRTALVASDNQVLQAIHTAMRSVSVPSGQLLPCVALAYRSRIAGLQFRWSDRQQHVERYYQQLDSDDAAVRARRPRRLILFPDIVLVSASSTDSTSNGSSSTSASSTSSSSTGSNSNSFSSNHDVLTVTWIVDTQEALLDTLSSSANVNGVVTNRPVEMLQILKEHYRKHCSRI